uniref:Uncharacterized protein n=1 Tax=Anguilla anguilla TaxID=7936 RepID=A0A0E9WMC3_ANGAN
MFFFNGKQIKTSTLRRILDSSLDCSANGSLHTSRSKNRHKLRFCILLIETSDNGSIGRSMGVFALHCGGQVDIRLLRVVPRWARGRDDGVEED